MTRVIYDRVRGEHVIMLKLDAEEARGIALALPATDAAVRELQEAADECDEMNRLNRDGDDG